MIHRRGEKVERYCELNEISDGKLYKLEDVVQADCEGCQNCSECCRNVGESIILDPFDIYEMTKHLKVPTLKLLEDKLELHVVDGVILPNIKTDNQLGGCGFLSPESRCTIHKFRPGFCRMFPLGRYYHHESFDYILQVHECPYPNKKPTLVKEWIGIPDMEKYEQYIKDWHYYIVECQQKIKAGMEEAKVKQINMYILQNFYLIPYDSNEDFYTQFYERFSKAHQEIPF